MSLPNTYKRLEYIQSSGTQYIDTNLVGKKGIKSKIEIEFTNVSGTQTVLGCRNDSNSRWYWLNIYTDRFDLGYGGEISSSITPIANHKYSFESYLNVGTQYLIIDGTKVIDNASTSSITENKVMYLLANNYSGAGNFVKAKLYSCKIYDNDILVRDFIPALRISDNVVGLYDLVNDVFYTNAGSGTFIYPQYEITGSVNPLNSGHIDGLGFYDNAKVEAIKNSGYEFLDWILKGYTQLDYIESTGTQYINTDVVAPSRQYELDLEISANTSGTLFGYKGNLRNNDVELSNGTLTFRFNQASKSVAISEGRHTLGVNTSYKAFVDDTIEESFSAYSSSANIPFFIFGNSNDSGSFSNPSSYKLFGCKIYDTDHNLVRDFIPVIRHSDGAIGLLDLVNLKFYGNNGTGVFNGGNEVGNIIYTDNPLQLNIGNDIELQANFKLDLVVNVIYNQYLGTASYGWGTGSEVLLSATPFELADFVGWFIDGTLISTESEYSYTVTADTTFEARFEYKFNWITCITDRTQQDVIAKTDKGYLNVLDFNRIEIDLGYLLAHYDLPIVIKYDWDMEDYPKQSDFTRILNNLSAVRTASGMELPEIPAEPINTYQKVNVIETILQTIYDSLIS